MTRPDLDALAALLAKATPGPWRAQCGEYGVVIVDGPPSGPFLIEVTDAPSDGRDQSSADATLIVAAVNTLPALIKRVRELERDRESAALAMRERAAQACAALKVNRPSDPLANAFDGACKTCTAAVRALEV